MSEDSINIDLDDALDQLENVPSMRVACNWKKVLRALPNSVNVCVKEFIDSKN